MYHRFHAPHDMVVERVNYIGGDTWNVNPVALARVNRLFCRNERAAIHGRLERGGHPIALVPVAAVLVASIRLQHALRRNRLRSPCAYGPAFAEAAPGPGLTAKWQCGAGWAKFRI